MLLVKLFGYGIGIIAILTSILIIVMGSRFREYEEAAYAGAKKPWWFYVAFIGILGFYAAALYSFLMSPDKTMAGWLLMVIIPVAVVLKSKLLIFSKKGQDKLLSIKDDRSWQKIGLARIPLGLIMMILAFFA